MAIQQAVAKGHNLVLRHGHISYRSGTRSCWEAIYRNLITDKRSHSCTIRLAVSEPLLAENGMFLPTRRSRVERTRVSDTGKYPCRPKELPCRATMNDPYVFTVHPNSDTTPHASWVFTHGAGYVH